MHKTLIGILFSFFVCTQIQAEISDIEIKNILTKNKEHWGPPNIGWQITFSENGKAEYHFAWEGSRSVQATYEVSKGDIIIRISGSAEEHDIKWLGRRTKCHIVKEKDSLEFLYSLACDNKVVMLFSHGHKRINQETIIDNIPAVTLGGQRAEAVATVKFRESPNLSSKTIYCKFERSEGGGVIPKGNQHIYLLARTKDKVRVEKMENYWYFIRLYVEQYDGESCKKEQGWVFGEFVKPLP